MSTKKQKTPLIKKPKTPLALTPLALWLGAQGVRLDGVRIDSDSTTGALRLVSTRAIGEEEAIIVVPKSAVLSVKTATNQAVEALLDEAALDKPGGFPDSAVQTLVVAFERSKGAASRWHDYLESMREVADLPILWSEDELALLRGTGLDVAARTWRAELAREHRTITRALREAGQHVGAEGAAMARLPLVSYVHAATLMASRGFFVDDSHGDGLVPAIDVANHKCALAPEGDGDSEEEEEEEEAAEAEEAEEEAEAEAEAKEEEGEGGLGPRSLRAAGPALRAAAAAVAGDASCLQMDCTFVGDEEEEGEDEDEDEEDEENAEDEGEEGEGGGRGVEEGGTKETKESGEGEGEEEEDEEDEDEEEEEEEDEGEVRLVAMRKLPVGVEVLNTYGEYPSRKLLLDYGFVPTDNPLDTAALTPSLLAAACAAELGKEQYEARRAALQQVGGARLLEGGVADGFSFHRMGEPPDALLLLLSLLLAPAPPQASAPPQKSHQAAAATAAGAAACRAFAALPASERHQRAAVVGADGLGLRVLARALQAQVASYDAEPLPSASASAAAAVLPADSWAARMQVEAKATGAQRREMATRLVQGELRIWKAAQAWVSQAGVAQAGGKQHAPQKSHQVKSHQVKSHQQGAAAVDGAPSQGGKRKRAKQ